VQPIGKKQVPPLDRREVAKNFFVAFGAVFLSRALMLLVGIIVARMLGKSEYGEFAFIQTTMNVAAELSGLGVGVAACRSIAQNVEHDKLKCGRVIKINLLCTAAMGAIAAALIAGFSEQLSSLIIHEKEVAGPLAYVAPAVFFAAISGACAGFLNGFGAFSSSARITICTAIASAAFLLPLCYFIGIKGLVIGIVLAQIAGCLTALILVRAEASRRGVRINVPGVLGETGSLLRYNLPATVSGLMVAPVTWVASLLLASSTGGLAELAVFAVSNQWKGALLFAPMALGNVMLPIFSRFASGDRGELMNVISLNARLVGIGAMVLVLLACVGSPYLLGLYGQGFSEGRVAFNLMMCVAGLMAINSVFGNVLNGLGAMWLGFGLNVLWAIALLGCAYFLSPRFGAIGLAIAYLISYLAHTLWQCMALIVIRRHEKS
jgi:O-antigen/teichoic acid export membrane protein